MSKKDVYKTVKKQSQSLLIEKKSKFIANVKPVDNEDDALAFLNEMRSKYSDATHNVYAYVIDENNIFRYSDDGVTLKYIPFSETRNYVVKVNSSWEHYKEMYQ